MFKKPQHMSIDTEPYKIKTSSYLSKRVISVMLCVFLISIGLVIFFIHDRNSSRFNYLSDAKMYTYGNMLYFTNVRKNVKLYSYNPVLGEIRTVINEPVYNFYANDEYYFYDCKSGLYCQNRRTAEEYRIIEYGKETQDKPAREYSGEFSEYNNSIYFVYSIWIDLLPDEYSEMGIENVVTLYRFDIETKDLTAIKRNYDKSGYPAPSNKPKGDPDYDPDYTGMVRPKDIDISNLNIIDDKLFYRNTSEVRSLSLDGKQDNIIYQAAGDIYQLDWRENGFYCFEKTQDNQFHPVEHHVNSVNLNGEILTSYTIPYEFEQHLGTYSMQRMYYDAQSDSYFAFYGGRLINFTLDNPQKYSSIITLKQTRDTSALSIITVDKSLFIFAYGALDHHSNKYSIFSVNDQNELITSIKNGKVVSR